MRITTGRFKGRPIGTVRDLSVRPATDRVRQSVFNILTHRMGVEGMTVLDLFAGTGSLGFEALSRGAARVTFVDNDPRVVRLLNTTTRTLRCDDAVTVVGADALDVVASARGPYDLVFADPPYAWQGTGRLPELIFSRGLVAPAGMLLIEHPRGIQFPPSPLYREKDQRTYGRTVVTMFHGAAETQPHEPTDGNLSGDV
jgi:16S rRNA (guanine(966)-N(2))-methyltransferase RsmD